MLWASLQRTDARIAVHAVSRQIRKLSREENRKARGLYEEVFPEDSRQFVDYYFQVKAAENEIYVAEERETGEILATLHLNPYAMCFCGNKVDTSYIVAVATKERYRHQGLMASLLRSSICDLYRRKSPFTWLMPAAEAIYLPFGFRYIYWKNEMLLDEISCQKIVKNKEDGLPLGCRIAEGRDLAKLEELAKRLLPSQAQVYTCHSQQYFEQLQKGLESEGAHILFLMAEEESHGYFLASAAEGEAWEIVVDEKYSRQAAEAVLRWFQGQNRNKVKISAFPQAWESDTECLRKPAIMGRIVHLETFVRCLKSAERKEWRIKLTDNIVLQNNGMFCIRTGPEGGSIEKLDCREDGMRELEVGQLLEELFHVTSFLNELV